MPETAPGSCRGCLPVGLVLMMGNAGESVYTFPKVKR